MASIWRYVIRRLLFIIPVFLAVSIITFVATNAAGNPLQLIRQGIHNLTPSQLAALEAYYHVNDPVYVRYFYWLSEFLQGNLGISLVYNTPVASAIWNWLATTLELQLTATFLSLAIGIPIGVHSARKQYSKTDVAVTTTAIFGVSMPTFWLGVMAIIVFSLDLHWLPSSGAYSPFPPYWWGNFYLDALAHLILPALVLTFVSLATIVRLVRANMLEILRSDFVTAARASGLKERTVVYKHALKNAIGPVLTLTGIGFGLIIGGAPALETTFTWPGLGLWFVRAASILDLPTVQGITMVITIMALIANLLVDLSYAWLDPRVTLT